MWENARLAIQEGRRAIGMRARGVGKEEGSTTTMMILPYYPRSRQNAIVRPLEDVRPSLLDCIGVTPLMEDVRSSDERCEFAYLTVPFVLKGNSASYQDFVTAVGAKISYALAWQRSSSSSSGSTYVMGL